MVFSEDFVYTCPMAEFVHLHNHTDYSLLDGAGSIKKYIKRTKELGMNALAITDHGNMFGAIEFYTQCRKADILPIIGCEFYIAPTGREIKDSNNKYYHLILLAMTDRGYHNLMELNTIAWTEGYYYKPRIDEQSLFEHSEGLICLSACLAGEIPQKLLSAYPEEAYETARKYKEQFPGRYFIELQRHGLEEEQKVLPRLVKLARDLELPLVATNDIHYVDKSDSNAHDILLCIGTGRKKSDENRLRYEAEQFYMRSPDEMAKLFEDYPEAIENTVKIAQMCADFKIEFPGPQLPEVDVPQPYADTKEYITSLAWEGLERRYPGYKEDEKQREVLEKRLTYELGVITKMGFDSYFLIVRDYIYWAKTHNIPVGAGRGSGAGSLVAYCIDITNVDPIAHDLLFERFLNPDRISLPDFDIDFCYEGRQDVINYVTEKYGKDRVGQIATFGTLKAKAVVKDVARVLDIPFDESNALTKYIEDVLPDDAKKQGYSSLLQYSLDTKPELAQFRARGGVYEELFDVSLRLENLSRHVSTHACGVVIGRTPLKNYVPLYMDPRTGSISTQYTMTVLEDCGLVKMDFLGLKTLTLLRNTVRLVRRRIPDFDLEKVPMDDPDTYRMMSNGDSTMVFQFESPGMQENLRKLEPTRFEELDAMTSLYRPGPMQFIPQYIDSRHGRTAIVYPDESLKDLLAPTYGVIVYQEQVMKVAQIIAGFSLGEADTLRKIMGKKKKDMLPEQEKKFIAGAVKNGHTEEHAKEIFDMLAPFAGYGFNKSHSVCYTVLSFRTAYMKCHFPAEFYAANLTNEISSGDKFKEYLDYVKGKGIKILPPDINNSDVFFNVVDGNIVYGLAGIKGVGEATVKAILEERNANGPFTDFMDFIRRADSRVLNGGSMEGLINSGTFDCFGYNRPTLLSNYEEAVRSVKEDKEAKSFGQNMLFGAEDEGMTSFEMKVIADYDLMQKLEIEKTYIGFYLSGHPLDTYREIWKNCVRLNIGKPERFTTGTKFNVMGLVTDVKTITTKSGSRMGHVIIEDYNGKLDVTVFPTQWSLCESVVQKGRIMAFRGSFKEYNGSASFSADLVVADMSQLRPLSPHKVIVEMDARKASRQTVADLKKLCSKYRGSASVEFVVYAGIQEDGSYIKPARHIAADPSFTLNATEDMAKEIRALEGVCDVYSE